MGAIARRIAIALLAVSVPTSARAAPDAVAQWAPFIAEASQRFGIPASWIERVMRAESAGHILWHCRPIRSRVGAMGLMQLMPETWNAMRRAYGLGSNPDDPHDNIMAGTAYLHMMAARFGYPGLFAAYNAGPGRYSAYLAGKSRLPGETIAYIGGITGHIQTVPVTAASTPRELLFVLRRELGKSPSSPSIQPSQDGMFAIKRSVP